MTSMEGKFAHNTVITTLHHKLMKTYKRKDTDTECIKPLYMYLLWDRFAKAALIFAFPIFGLFPPPLPRLCGVTAPISPLVTERNQFIIVEQAIALTSINDPSLLLNALFVGNSSEKKRED